ncbi:ComEA family DNA-binding protein [Glaciecola siphonariae]|uniref:ComEA family DNA-binding protein n=1 Tax=Glaciecola siphonariae TaxID=521012 RepID=A0ABV9LU55_9ALTE
MTLKTVKLKTWLAACGIALASLFVALPAAAQQSATQVNSVVSIVNINTADVETLSSLPGVGPKKAESIISYRELNGNFASVDELVNVKGIGKRMVERLLDKVTI